MGAFINGVYHEHAEAEASYAETARILRSESAAAHARIDAAVAGMSPLMLAPMSNPYLGYTRPENEAAIQAHESALARYEAVQRRYSTVMDKPGDPVGIQP